MSSIKQLWLYIKWFITAVFLKLVLINTYILNFCFKKMLKLNDLMDTFALSEHYSNFISGSKSEDLNLPYSVQRVKNLSDKMKEDGAVGLIRRQKNRTDEDKIWYAKTREMPSYLEKFIPEIRNKKNKQNKQQFPAEPAQKIPNIMQTFDVVKDIEPLQVVSDEDFFVPQKKENKFKKKAVKKKAIKHTLKTKKRVKR